VSKGKVVMSQVSTEHGSSLLDQWSQDQQAQAQDAGRRPSVAARVLSSNVLDKLVTGTTIVLLAPAIVAVWIAIWRSGSRRPRAHSPSLSLGVIGQNATTGSPTAQPQVLLSIKPTIQAISA
jgi:hypothetical protein